MKHLRWFARRSLQLFAAAAAIVAVGLIIAINLTSMETVLRATTEFREIMRWVRPPVLAAIVIGWPWLLAFLHRRKWLDDDECYVLLVRWEEIAVLIVTVELAVGQGLWVPGLLFYAAWRVYRRIRPARPMS